MPFHAPSWMPKLPFDPPDNVTIPEFMFNPQYGSHPRPDNRPIFTDAVSGRAYGAAEVQTRFDALARGLAQEMGWAVNEGSEWDKVVGVFSVNTIDVPLIAWATHQLGGIDSPANAAYTKEELEHQFMDSGAKCLFTCLPLLETAVHVAHKIGIPKNRIFLVSLPKQMTGGKEASAGFKTLDQLVEQGHKAPRLEKLKLAKGDGAKRVAFLCYSSGTSGLPKGVMISHRNVIANVLQIATFESRDRSRRAPPGSKFPRQDNVLGLLPMNHIYALILVVHTTAYQGNNAIVLPKYDFAQCMSAIQDYKINSLMLVPPIVIQMVNNKDKLKKYDFSHVTNLFTGAAPLGAETADALQSIYPSWAIKQGYGLTETCTVVTSTDTDDIWMGSVGSIIPGFEVKIMSIEGNEITGYDQPGELWAKGPSVTLGYLNRPDATTETYVDGFMRTGDEAVVRVGPNGTEHVFIVDRIKELIKVKGLQVAPAELEAHLLTHPAVADCAVISIPDDSAGERPKAYVVKAAGGAIEDSPRILMREIQKHVEKDKARHKWLKEVEFIDEIPKSPSGKILRRHLRDKHKQDHGRAGAKL